MSYIPSVIALPSYIKVLSKLLTPKPFWLYRYSAVGRKSISIKTLVIFLTLSSFILLLNYIKISLKLLTDKQFWLYSCVAAYWLEVNLDENPCNICEISPFYNHRLRLINILPKQIIHRSDYSKSLECSHAKL